MKTEEHLEAIAVFIQRVTAAVSELKEHLQQDYERTYPDLGEIISIVLDEEEAKAWELSFRKANGFHHERIGLRKTAVQS